MNMRHIADLIAFALSLSNLDLTFHPDIHLGFTAVNRKTDNKMVVLFGRGHYADNRFYDYRVGLESTCAEISGFGVPEGALHGDPQPYVPVAEIADHLRNLNDAT